MYIHPVVKILLYLSCLVALCYLPPVWFFAALLISSLGAFYVAGADFLKRCTRLKWVFLSILLIYAFSTPGEYLQLFSGVVDVTREGLMLGFTQVGRLVVALACLTMVFYKTGAEALIAGLYGLLSPLRFLGVDVERFVVRLSLTLQYVASLTGDFSRQLSVVKLFDMIQSAHFNVPAKRIVINDSGFSALDWAVVVLLLIVPVGLFLVTKGFV